MKPNRYQAIRMITLICFVLVFESLILTGSHVFKSQEWTPLLFVAYVLGASFIGRALAYFTIFEFVRHWFTTVSTHSSGVGDSVDPIHARKLDPAWKIVREVIGTWIYCPMCAGAWGALGLALLYEIDPASGRLMIFVLGGAGGGSILTRSVETIEWAGHYFHEMTGHWDRVNRIEQEHNTLTTINTIEIYTNGEDENDQYYYETDIAH